MNQTYQYFRWSLNIFIHGQYKCRSFCQISILNYFLKEKTNFYENRSKVKLGGQNIHGLYNSSPFNRLNFRNFRFSIWNQYLLWHEEGPWGPPTRLQPNLRKITVRNSKHELLHRPEFGGIPTVFIPTGTERNFDVDLTGIECISHSFEAYLDF